MSQIMSSFQVALCISKSTSLTQRNRKHGGYHSFRASYFLTGSWVVVNQKKSLVISEKYRYKGENLDPLPHIQTLREFPQEELAAKVVLVRFDPTVLLQDRIQSGSSAISTIQYLYKSRARVVLLSDWNVKQISRHLVAASVADLLSSKLQLKILPVQSISYNMFSALEGFSKADILLLDNLSEFKEEVSNCSIFSERLASGVDIFVNDSFSQSHRILASTVGVTRFCCASVAGFHFEESVTQLKNAAKVNRQPYFAIIGGGDLSHKAAALRFLASKCDGLIFIGMMSFQIMHAFGLSVPPKLVEPSAVREALDIIHFSLHKNIQILYPDDFWCKNEMLSDQVTLFPAHDIPDGWLPVDLGPLSMHNINSSLTKCKKIIWIGPVKFSASSQFTNGASELAKMLNQLSQRNCDVTVVGHMACKAIMQESSSASSAFNMFMNASVVWEFLKGKKLPGILALDRAHPYEFNWNTLYLDPDQPLVVDIGSGNGMFLLEMARRRKDLNFLGLEINDKLVRRCLDAVNQLYMKNGHFISTNATSTFRSIVSTYPGKLLLVSIQCPNPDFSKPEQRWRMVQRSLVEAIADLLSSQGKVFLQSDIKSVAVRMKENFLRHGKGKLVDQEGWLDENPFGVRSDWEQHVIDRGSPMFRLLLSKLTTIE